MIKLLSSQGVAEMEMLQGLLAENGIVCTVRNLYTTTARGMPRPDAWPELWVLHDADMDRARAVLAREAEEAPAWVCPDCGEESEGQFAACWNCGAVRPTATL